MIKNVLLKKRRRDFFGKLLMLLIIVMLVIVYILLIFNRIFADISYIGYWFLYITFGLLLFSLSILLHKLFLPLVSNFKTALKNIREWHENRKMIRNKEKMIRLLEEKKRRAERSKLGAEALRKKEEEKRLLEQRKSEELKEKKPSIFRLFKRRIKYGKGEKKEGKGTVVKELPKDLRIEIKRYETDIDVLYKIIEKEGRVKLSALASYFNVDKKKIEEWATILEENGFLRIHYPAIGEPELRRIKNG